MISMSNGRTALALATLATILAFPGMLPAQERKIPDTYTAVTTNMSPADVEIKADILQWSSDEARAAVIAALGEEDPVAALSALDTHGVVWRSGSAVGHSIKYAHRDTAADGTETITLLTDKAVGSSSFMPWTADNAAVDTPPTYSVIELQTGNGAQGSMSLAAAVVIDTASNTVSLDRQGTQPLLTNVVKQPPPYWARSGN